MTLNSPEYFKRIAEPLPDLIMKLGTYAITFNNISEINHIKKQLLIYSDTEIFDALDFILEHRAIYQLSTPFALLFFFLDKHNIIDVALRKHSPVGDEYPLLTESFFTLEFIHKVISIDIAVLPKLFLFQSTLFNSNHLYGSRAAKKDFYLFFRTLNNNDISIIREYFFLLLTHLHIENIPLSPLNSKHEYYSFFLFLFSHLVPETYPDEWMELLNVDDTSIVRELVADLMIFHRPFVKSYSHHRFYYCPPNFLPQIFKNSALCAHVFHSNLNPLFEFCDFETAIKNNPELFAIN